MKLMSWLHGKLVGRQRDVISEAIDATEEATIRTRSLRKQLEPFRLEDDPFAAIVRKQIMAEGYESAQLASIYRGPVP